MPSEAQIVRNTFVRELFDWCAVAFGAIGLCAAAQCMGCVLEDDGPDDKPCSTREIGGTAHAIDPGDLEIDDDPTTADPGSATTDSATGAGETSIAPESTSTETATDPGDPTTNTHTCQVVEFPECKYWTVPLSPVLWALDCDPRWPIVPVVGTSLKAGNLVCETQAGGGAKRVLRAWRVEAEYFGKLYESAEATGCTEFPPPDWYQAYWVRELDGLTPAALEQLVPRGCPIP